MKTSIPNDLNKLVPIPEAHIKDRRHSMARCEWPACNNPVSHKMVVEEWPFGHTFYNTKYWCKEHSQWK